MTKGMKEVLLYAFLGLALGGAFIFFVGCEDSPRTAVHQDIAVAVDAKTPDAGVIVSDLDLCRSTVELQKSVLELQELTLQLKEDDIVSCEKFERSCFRQLKQCRAGAK